ncbi:MAG: hypothetical protein M3297_09350 [Thermoproteota archaeon]|jgi:hypothetical protein|nr:hypothetical protein [Thermoproteota archaeon]
MSNSNTYARAYTESPTEELTANCGGVPCTLSEKEDSSIEVEDSGPTDPGSDQESLPPRVPEPPDDDCLYDPSLLKCAPIDGKCPVGLNMNEDEIRMLIRCKSSLLEAVQ